MNTIPQFAPAAQPACPVNEWLGALSEATRHGLVDPAEAAQIKAPFDMGLLTDEGLKSRVLEALRAGPTAGMVLDAIAPAFAPGDVIELRAVDPAGGGAVALSGRLNDPAQREALADFVRGHIGQRNLYFGINPRKADLAGTTRAASEADVAARRIIVLDLDRKDAPVTDPDWSRTVEALAVDANMVLDSGNGVHVWLDLEPVSGADLAASGAPLAAAMARLGADNMADAPRITRLPFTLNLPTAAKRKRGASIRLAAPLPIQVQTNTVVSPAAPSVAALCAKLDAVAARLGLPGRGGAGAASAASHVASDGGQKTPHAAPSADLLRMALEALPNQPGGAFDDRNEWVKMAHAIKGAAVAGGFEAEGCAAFVEWSQQWGGDPDASRAVWDGITASHVGWGTLMQALRAINPAGAANVKAAEAIALQAQAAAQTRAIITGAPFAPVSPIPPTQIPPRRWLYGSTAIAGFLSFLIAPGGAGKSALMVGEAVAMATGRELLPGEKPVRALRVWMHNAEDDFAEMQRRLAATLHHFGLKHADLNDNLFMTSGRDMRLQLARTGRDGPEIVPGVVDGLVERLVTAKIDVLILDPLGALHTLPENSNEAANLLSGALREIAHRADVAVIVLHHAGKAAATDMDAAGAGASRGASAFVDAARVVRQVVRLTDREAARYGIAEADRRDYLRVENGKANLARAEGGRWLRMVDVALGNGAGLWPLGDRVGVVERWTPPAPQPGTASDLARVQNAIAAAGAPPRFSPKALDWVGFVVADALELKIGQPGATSKTRTTEEAAAHVRVLSLLDGWFADGSLIRLKGRDPAQRKDVDVVAIGKPAILSDADAPDGEGTE